jgi:hypothetical protein
MKVQKSLPAVNKVYRPVTDKDWKELMGMNRDTYKRGKGGALRNKRRN